MEYLWAPWRMQFIEELRDSGGTCIFCERAQDQGEDRKHLVLHRGIGCYVLMNRYPYNNGHILIIPHQHEEKLSALPASVRTEMMDLCATSVDIMREALNADGCNCGINIGAVAGAGIKDHIHLHVVPRWCGDANFMPIIGDTASMPEYLDDTYQRLRPCYERIA